MSSGSLLVDWGCRLDARMASLLRIDPCALPLREYSVYTGTDYAAASQSLSGIAEERSLELVNEAEAPSYIELHRAQLNHSQIALTANTAATRLHITAGIRHFTFVLPLCGFQELNTPNGRIVVEPGHASLSVVGQTLETVRSPHYVALIASLSCEGYKRLFGHTVEDLDLDLSRYPKVFPVTDERYSSLLSILGTLCYELNEGRHLYLRQNMVISRLEEALWMRFVDLYPPLEPDSVAVEPNQIVPGYINRARAYIDEHAREEIAISELVEIAGVTSRSLQSGFKTAFGCSPTGYIRKVKLSGIRRELLEADPEAAQVSDIAATWGIYHMGHLAHYYREQFAELPSETLKRDLSDG